MSLDVSLVCRCCGQEFYSANITHNLIGMAKAAKVYNCLWRPEETGLEQARQLVPLLSEGLALLKADPEKFRKFNSPNGWGLYENFVPFVEGLLAACQKHPDSVVRACC